MIPWLWLVAGDMAAAVYAIAVNIVFWIALIPEIRQMHAIKESGNLVQFKNATQFNVVDIDGKERVDVITMMALRQRIGAWWREKLVVNRRL